ncbi:UNVERIFIED_CONTAM: hypothetical protein Sradi_3240700 [Sesamum radiatum]|uniref:Uncharacterized protein n=1 Tax=Sesamum radiatum TaxID=300843 RepID=A0AAW2RGR3_SESRA
MPEYCTLCKHVGHQDSVCYSKGNAPKPPGRTDRGKRVADERGKKQMVNTVVTQAACKVFDERPERKEEAGGCSKTAEARHRYASAEVDLVEFNADVDTVVVEDDVSIRVNQNDDENSAQIVEVNHNKDENGAHIVEGNQIDDECDAAIVKMNEDEANENVIQQHSVFEGDHALENETIGALILKPINFACARMRGRNWINIDSALRLHESLKRFGIAIEGLPEDVVQILKRNRLAVKSAILYQKCVLIFNRVSGLLLKPLDERSPSIATRTRRRKKGKYPLEPPDDVHYFSKRCIGWKKG